MKKDKVVTVKVNSEMWHMFKVQAAKDQITLGQLIENFVVQYLRERGAINEQK